MKRICHIMVLLFQKCLYVKYSCDLLGNPGSAGLEFYVMFEYDECVYMQV